ncbi:MAG: oxygen-independent coproporphyrinogen III oxidase [Butyrivibrio sp.]|nr:oxygen-independent coproporphyrinogen III oxidase [Butyrivibrio sp.]
MNKDLSLYVHIPFCVRKCLYCDFLSFSANEEVMKAYFKALSKELKESAKDYSDSMVKTVFFGGGTPSFPNANYICSILSDIKDNYNLAADAEISLELNPGTASFDKLKKYKEAGFNRLSIGVQSFDDDELKRIGRIHDCATAQRTYEDARKAGFTNINLDVMSALPGQSLESYLNTLKKAVSLDPEHISAYSLIVEEGTPFFDMDLDLPGEEEDRAMYHKTAEKLQDFGYHRYEISNYAKDGFECEHNKVYWKRGNYLGVGLGAASMVDDVRWTNTGKIDDYIAYFSGDSSFAGIRENVEKLTLEDRMEEFMFLGLRLITGVDLAEFEALFGKKIEDVYAEVIGKYVGMGLLRRFVEEKTCREHLCLTTQGLDVSNTVMADFIIHIENSIE